VIAREVRYGVGYGGACSIESLLMSPDLRKSDECDIGFMKKVSRPKGQQAGYGGAVRQFNDAKPRHTIQVSRLLVSRHHSHTHAFWSADSMTMLFFQTSSKSVERGTTMNGCVKKRATSEDEKSGSPALLPSMICAS
jgi:hypothetical protein